MLTSLLLFFHSLFQPYLSGLMTKNWLNTDTDFNELVNRIEMYSGYSKSMKYPHVQVSMIIWALGKLIQKRICYTLS